MTPEQTATKARLRKLIAEQTRPIRPPLVPEMEFWGADDYAAIWSATEERLEALALPPPFWAFAWPGGQALARFLFDVPDLVRGRVVLALASGAGIEACAAAKAGARWVVANDIDPAAAQAAQMNAERNCVEVETCTTDLTQTPSDGLLDPCEADVVLLGDALYERALSDAFLEILCKAAESGADVLVAGPDRGFHPHTSRTYAVETLIQYRVPTRKELEDCGFRDVVVMRLCASGSTMA